MVIFHASVDAASAATNSKHIRTTKVAIPGVSALPSSFTADQKDIPSKKFLRGNDNADDSNDEERAPIGALLGGAAQMMSKRAKAEASSMSFEALVKKGVTPDDLFAKYGYNENAMQESYKYFYNKLLQKAAETGKKPADLVKVFDIDDGFEVLVKKGVTPDDLFAKYGYNENAMQESYKYFYNKLLQKAAETGKKPADLVKVFDIDDGFEVLVKKGVTPDDLFAKYGYEHHGLQGKYNLFYKKLLQQAAETGKEPADLVKIYHIDDGFESWLKKGVTPDDLLEKYSYHYYGTQVEYESFYKKAKEAEADKA
ncbi:hypothetical protein PRIC1_004170 [Phytophthora ramorum]